MLRLLLRLVVVVAVSGPVMAAQSVVVPNDQINAVKREYPFVRFSQLTHLDAPLPPRHDQGSASRPAPAASRIPAGARAFHKQKVSIRGYVVPIDVDRRGISEFIQSSNIDSCHFGVIGGPDEWIYVKMADDRRMPAPGTAPVTVFGVLDVGEDVKDGLVDSLYRMRVDRVALH
ncbi:MAG: DUF3299 domain-containing protein [Vicinamibacterales bacterium]